MDGFHDNKWFVYINDHHEGPFSMATLQAKLHAGELNRTQYVWREGMGDWQLITQVRELDELFSSPPPAPESSSSSDRGPVFDGTLSNIPAIESQEPSFDVPLESAAASKNSETLQALQDEQFDQVVTMESPDPMREARAGVHFESQLPKRGRSSGFLKTFLFLTIIGTGIYGLISGAFDPVLKSPRLASSASLIKDLTRPPLTKLAQWVPQLQNWISPIPSLMGVPDTEQDELAKLARQNNPPGIAVGLSKTDLASPSIYLASALPNGAKFDLILVGVPETLLSQTSLVIKASTELQNRLASVLSLRQPDGRPLTPGEYRLYVTESEASSQLQSVASVISNLPDASVPFPAESEIQGTRKLFLQKTYFLGGEKDDTYSKRLKDFHDRLRARSQEELTEVGTLLQKLSAQLSATADEHKKLFGGKPIKNADKRWNEFHEKWTGIQTQLEQGFSGWAEAISRKEFYHWGLYQLIRSASEKISQLHVQQHSGVLIRPSDLQEFQKQLAEKLKGAQDALGGLETKLSESRKLNES